jgi:LysR family nitrogen assimilation transcriptional regulator
MTTRLELTLQRRIDIAIVDMVRGAPGLSVKPLWREPLCILCRSDDARFVRPMLDLQELAGIDLVNGFTDTSPRRVLDEAMERAGLHNTPIIEVDAFSTSKRLMLAGHAPTVNTPALVAAELRSGLVRAIPIRGLYLNRAVAISDEHPAGVAVRFVAEQIAECAREMIALGEWPLAEALDASGSPTIAPSPKVKRTSARPPSRA